MTFTTAQHAANLLARIDRRARGARTLATDAKRYARDPAPIKLWAFHPDRIERVISDLRGLSALIAEVEQL